MYLRDNFYFASWNLDEIVNVNRKKNGSRILAAFQSSKNGNFTFGLVTFTSGLIAGLGTGTSQANILKQELRSTYTI